jgi:hypothetical protein
MKTIIQRYAGLNDKNCPIWVDTAFTSLADANRFHSHHTYRTIQTDAMPVHTYWADIYTVGIKPCCERHAA